MKAAIAGIGMTALTRASGRTALDQAGEAIHLALADAGLGPGDVDGVLTYAMNDSVPAHLVAKALALDTYRWHNDIAGGGTQAASILVDAAMAIEAGLASTIVVYRAMNGRSGVRMGQSTESTDAEFTLPYGLLGPVSTFAMAAQRFLHDRGRDATDLGRVAVKLRANAGASERAIMRDPITLDDYFASPLVASPLRRLDCCQETDGACALVVTMPDRAGDRGVRIHAGVRGGGLGAITMDRASDVTALFTRWVAPLLWEASGMTAADVDVALLYDAYTFLVLAQLEDLGLCGPGEAADYVESGRVPVNPHGGLLSEGYVHGLNNVLEAVRQLRGEGTNQVASPEVALVTGFGGDRGSALLLRSGGR